MGGFAFPLHFSKRPISWFCRYNAVTGDWVEDEVLIKMASQVRSHCSSCLLAAKFVISFLLLNSGSKMFSSYRSFEVSVSFFSYLSFFRRLIRYVLMSQQPFFPQSRVEHGVSPSLSVTGGICSFPSDLPFQPSHFLLASSPCLAIVLLFCVLPDSFCP